MALYSELTLDIAVYAGTSKASCRFSTKFEDKTLDTTLVLSSGARVSLAASAADQAVDFQSVANGQLVVLKSDSEFSVKLNGSADAITLKPQTNGSQVETPAFLAMLADGITAMTLSNPSATDAIEVDIGIAGV